MQQIIVTPETEHVISMHKSKYATRLPLGPANISTGSIAQLHHRIITAFLVSLYVTIFASFFNVKPLPAVYYIFLPM